MPAHLARLHRSSKGKIHRADCRLAEKLQVWIWAEDKTANEIKAYPWNTPCKVCKPLDGWEPTR